MVSLAHCVLFVWLFMASSQDQSTSVPTPVLHNIKTELESRGGFTKIITLLKSSGLLDKLHKADSMTLFAPTDAALARSPVSDEELEKVLEYHTIPKSHVLVHFGGHDERIFNSTNGLQIRINSYFHKRIISANGVRILERPIKVSNGYVHALDGVLSPPLQGDVVDILSANGALTTFFTLLSTAGQEETLRSYQTTVFAPRDSAFAKLDAQIAQYLLASPDHMLELVLYHMVNRPICYTIGMVNTQALQTFSNNRSEKLLVFEDLVAGTFKVNNALIVEKDILATNGLVHVIDEVLIPTSFLVHMQAQGVAVG